MNFTRAEKDILYETNAKLEPGGRVHSFWVPPRAARLLLPA